MRFAKLARQSHATIEFPTHTRTTNGCSDAIIVTHATGQLVVRIAGMVLI